MCAERRNGPESGLPDDAADARRPRHIRLIYYRDGGWKEKEEEEGRVHHVEVGELPGTYQRDWRASAVAAPAPTATSNSKGNRPKAEQ